MSLTDLVKKFIRRPAVLGLALAIAPTVYSCGGEEENKACVSDMECNVDRVCYDGKCVDGDGNADSGSSEEGPCGNSPLNGKYLWNVGNCESGAVTPGDPTTCTFKETFSGCEDDVDSGYKDEFCPFLEMRYEGSTIFSGGNGPNGGDGELTRDFSCSEIEIYPPDRERCGAYQCAIAKDDGLYIIQNKDDDLFLEDNLYRLMDVPWVNNSSCRAFENKETKPYLSLCFSWGEP